MNISRIRIEIIGKYGQTTSFLSTSELTTLAKTDNPITIDDDNLLFKGYTLLKNDDGKISLFIKVKDNETKA